MHLALIGAGSMGSAIGRNLLHAGHSLTVYNRSRERAEPLIADGAKFADTPAAVASAETIFTMLSEDRAVEEVFWGSGGLFAALPAGAVHVMMSTISVALSERLAAEHAKAGHVYIASPVLGRPEAAAAAKLFLLIAGPADAIDRLQPVWDVLGQRVFRIGDHAPAAHTAKLGCNFLIAAVIESLGEVFALTRKSGLDSQMMLDIITGTIFSAPVYKTYGSLIVEEKYQPAGFKVPLGLKDVRLVMAAGEAARVPMPLASLLHDHFLQALAQGQEELDWSSLAKVAARNAGL